MTALFIGYFSILFLLAFSVSPLIFMFLWGRFENREGFSLGELFKIGIFILLSQLVATIATLLVGSLFFIVGLKSIFLVRLIGLIFSLVAGLFIIEKRLQLSLIRSFTVFLVFSILFILSFFPIRGFLSFFINPFSIPSGAMEDTLLVGDNILSNQIYYGHSFFNKTKRFLEFHQPQKGDIVTFVYPQDHSKTYIKRCIGTPDDVIQMKKKILYVNGKKQNEPYVKHIDPATNSPDNYFLGNRDNFGPVTVEAGHYFMMGDNRDNSYDSRYWGQLDEKLILGKAVGIYWQRKNDHLILKDLN